MYVLGKRKYNFVFIYDTEISGGVFLGRKTSSILKCEFPFRQMPTAMKWGRYILTFCCCGFHSWRIPTKEFTFSARF